MSAGDAHPHSQPGTTGSGASRTPLEALEGMITPSGLHFERHHNGVPAIDPAQHQLLIHGMVARPLIFTVASLLRYPMVSRIHFLECSGNSGAMYQPKPPALTCGLTGLVSCSGGQEFRCPCSSRRRAPIPRPTGSSRKARTRRQ